MTDSEESLEREFLKAAINRSQFLQTNDSKMANEEYDKLHEIRRRMRELPDRGEAALKRIAGVLDASLQVNAAASLPALDERFATGILENVRDRNAGLISLSAAMTLREWQNGSLREYLG